jgi:hypothetical protein
MAVLFRFSEEAGVFAKYMRARWASAYSPTVWHASDAGGESEPPPGSLAVGTMHSAKGLQWDIVFLAGLGVIGWDPARTGRPRQITLRGQEWRAQKSGNPEEHRREERRLLYVAASRPRSLLHLSYTGELTADCPPELEYLGRALEANPERGFLRRLHCGEARHGFTSAERLRSDELHDLDALLQSELSPVAHAQPADADADAPAAEEMEDPDATQAEEPPAVAEDVAMPDAAPLSPPMSGCDLLPDPEHLSDEPHAFGHAGGAGPEDARFHTPPPPPKRPAAPIHSEPPAKRQSGGESVDSGGPWIARHRSLSTGAKKVPHCKCKTAQERVDPTSRPPKPPQGRYCDGYPGRAGGAGCMRVHGNACRGQCICGHNFKELAAAAEQPAVKRPLTFSRP